MDTKHIGRTKGGGLHGPKFSQFHAVFFWKIVCWRPPLTGNPGSASERHRFRVRFRSLRTDLN